MGFAPGRLIVHRNLRHDRLGWVRPVRVVSDDDRGLLVWLASGSVVANEVAADGRGMRGRPFAEWITLSHGLREHSWDGPGVLKFHPVGADHSVWWFRDAAGRFANWYVNLEERAIRWDDGDLAGIDVVDQDLDIVVDPDRTWRWKDEDEFTERLAFPDHYWVRDEAAVRDEGWRVVKQIEAGEFPFDGTWTDFQPDPVWETPTTLPAGWNRAAAARLSP
jgi:predicted RNA-binding protein associated with RNAse of E/G family